MRSALILQYFRGASKLYIRILTLAYYSTKSNRTEAPEVQGIEEFEIHPSTVGVVKTRAIIDAWVRGAWIRHHQFCKNNWYDW